MEGAAGYWFATSAPWQNVQKTPPKSQSDSSEIPEKKGILYACLKKMKSCLDSAEEVLVQID